jgi:hypothetical protein
MQLGQDRGSCCAFRAIKIGVFVFTVFLNEVNIVPVTRTVFFFFGMPVAYEVPSVDVINHDSSRPTSTQDPHQSRS